MTLKRLLACALFPIVLASSNLYSETKWLFEGQGNDVRAYDVKNGRKKLKYSTVKIPTSNVIDNKKGWICDNDFCIDEQIKDRKKYIKELPAKFDYLTAVYNWKYFDEKRAEKIADKLAKDNKLKSADKKIFIAACSKWPFVKFYSQKCSENYYHIDSRLSYLVFMIENRFENGNGSCGEIGSAQLMPKTIKDGIKSWSKSPYWIEGYGAEHPINNLLGGIQHIISCEKNPGCEKNLEKMTDDELKRIYSVYVSGEADYDNAKYWIKNLAENVKYLYLLPYIDKATAKGNLINEKGKIKLEREKGKRKKVSNLISISEAKIFKYAFDFK